MTKQTKSLGGLADLQASPPPTPETTEERIDRLERQLLQVQTILNDVIQQLDAPYREKPRSNGKPKQAKHQQAKPKQVKPKQAKPSLPKAKKKAPATTTPATTEEEKRADNESIIAFLHQHPDRLWKTTHLQKAIKANCNLSNKRASSAIKRLRKTGHFVIVQNVEVDDEILAGAYQFVPEPESTD